MRALLDGRGAARGGTGIATYVRALAANLVQVGQNEVRCLCYWGERDAYRSLGARPWGIPSGRLFRSWQLPRVAVTHGPNFRALDVPRARRVITVHDLAFLKFPDDYPPAVATELTNLLERQQWVVERALCASAATEHDLLGAYPGFDGRTNVVHLGVHESWFEPPARTEIEDTLRSLGIAKPFILHLGALVPRKDVPTLVQAWLLARRERPKLGLVLAGPDARGWKSDAETVAGLLASAPDGAAHVLGPVSDQVARRLMAAADAYVTTTKLEGFGLPVLEAMAAGVPVVATSDAATAEVGGETIEYVAARDPDLIAAAIAQTLDQPDETRISAARERARGYSWRRCAQQTLAVYRELDQI